jgi:hypothetical protein
MNEENFEYLNNNLRFLGFGEGLNDALHEELQNLPSEFQLSYHTLYALDEVEAILHFRKSHINEMYFFDKYYLRLWKHGETAELIQPFYIYKGKGITCKEGYNLLCGRAVRKDLTNREGQAYNAWLKLDLSVQVNESYKIKQYHQNYGFDLMKALSHLPIKEMKEPDDQERLIKSLEKGNLQQVNFQRNGRERKLWISANPRFKTINVYDSTRSLVKEYSKALPTEDDPAIPKNWKELELNEQLAEEGTLEEGNVGKKDDRARITPFQQGTKRKRIPIRNG